MTSFSFGTSTSSRFAETSVCHTDLRQRDLGRSSDLLGVNELHVGRCRSLVQLVSLGWSDEVGVGRQGCCTSLLYLYSLALEDGEVVRRARSRAAHMLMIIRVTWQEAGDDQWPPSVIFRFSRNRDGTSGFSER